MRGVKISFIVPVFNKEEHIIDCLNSLISQDMDDIEIIVVDDGSSDDTSKILKEYKDKIILKEIGKNSGVFVATSEIKIDEITFLNLRNTKIK